MATARDLMDRAKIRIEADRAEAGAVGAVYKFVLAGDDGGTYILDLADTPGVVEGDGDAECVIRMAAKDFVKMIEGPSDPKFMFFTGKLKVEGDLAVAMKLTKFTQIFS